MRYGIPAQNRCMEVIQMAGQSNTNQMAVPEAKAAMNRFK